MTFKKPALLSWSGGKDSLMALWKLAANYEVVALLTNLNQETNRVSVHGIRREIIEAQAAALGLDVHFVMLPAKPANDIYEAQVNAAIEPFRENGVQHVIYGDLFLEDIRAYRNAFLSRLNMHGLYPLWKLETSVLIEEFLLAGFKALITCVDAIQLDPVFAGRELDAAFLNDLPANVDPCGENGEFHTLVYAVPLFNSPIPIVRGNTWSEDDRFHFCDVHLLT